MAVNLKVPDIIYPLAGVRLGVAYAGIRKQAKPDLLVIELTPDSLTSVVFTQNAFCAAPVIISRQHIKQSQPRYLLINAGNANAGTGEAGLIVAQKSCQYLAEKKAVKPSEILVFSTGVIGEYLAIDKIKAGIDQAIIHLEETNWLEAAQAIMTTDTMPKIVSKQIIIDEKLVTITGMVKGAGMIHPDMATLLAFIGTDVKISAELLNNIWQQVNAQSFNCISVDGDTSTNDSAVLFATQQGQLEITEANYGIWYQAVLEVAQTLAQAVIRDAEGATKLLTIYIKIGKNSIECQQIAKVIATSPLIKTALFAADPNWGRILAAIGRTGLNDFDIALVNIWLNEVMIVRQGQRNSEYTEAQGVSVMQQPEITLTIDLKRGTDSITFWTCDFSYDYVRINAEYRT